MNHKRRAGRAALALTLAACAGLAAVEPASAYMGPGAGLTALGSLLALFAAIGLAVVGFLWYPLKRLFSRRKIADAEHNPDADPGAAGGDAAKR